MMTTIENIKAGILKRAARGFDPVSMDPRQRGMASMQVPQAPAAPAVRQYTQGELNTYKQRRADDAADLHNRTQRVLGTYQPVGPGAGQRQAELARVQAQSKVPLGPVTAPPRAYAPAPAPVAPPRPMSAPDLEAMRQSIAAMRNMHPASPSYDRPLSPAQQQETIQLETELQRARQTAANTEADKQLTGYLDQDEFTRFRDRSLMAARRMQELRQNAEQDQAGSLYSQLSRI